MTGLIDRLEIQNFKSYGGKHVIGPFKTFSAIIGPNGAGKSNLMDAISFVLGVQTKKLRGQELRDLIHRKGEEKSADRMAYVELVYNSESTGEIRFRRVIKPQPQNKAVSAYLLNDETVKWEQYNEQLKNLGVLVRARNFLVFQGDVEQIAQKSEKDLTSLFEQISESAELKEEYDQLKEKALQADEMFYRTFEKKRNMAKEKKQLKEQKDEAERFQELLDERNKTKREFFLWQLYHVENDLSNNEADIERFKEALEKKEKRIQ